MLAVITCKKRPDAADWLVDQAAEREWCVVKDE
jgi:hypothetical protein